MRLCVCVCVCADVCVRVRAGIHDSLLHYGVCVPVRGCVRAGVFVCFGVGVWVWVCWRARTCFP